MNGNKDVIVSSHYYIARLFLFHTPLLPLTAKTLDVSLRLLDFHPLLRRVY